MGLGMYPYLKKEGIMQDKITKDYIQAMKAKDRERSTVINFLRAKIKDVLIEKRVEKLEDIDIIAVIKKQVKQRQDSIEQFKNGGRTDLVEKEEFELSVLKAYLPEEMAEAELEPIIIQTVNDLGALSMKDMGKVMKTVSEKVSGRADNKLVSELVKKTLLKRT